MRRTLEPAWPVIPAQRVAIALIVTRVRPWPGHPDHTPHRTPHRCTANIMQLASHHVRASPVPACAPGGSVRARLAAPRLAAAGSQADTQDVQCSVRLGAAAAAAALAVVAQLAAPTLAHAAPRLSAAGITSPYEDAKRIAYGPTADGYTRACQGEGAGHCGGAQCLWEAAPAR
jgi:hypothetical protein